MLSVKALAESEQEPPVLFGPRDPCEEYAHLDQTSQCTAIKPEPKPKIAPESYKLNHNYGKIIS